MASTQACTHDSNRIASALGRDPYIDHERVERPDPEVIGPPPRDLAE